MRDIDKEIFLVRFLNTWKERLGVKGLEREILRDRCLEIVRDIRAYRFRNRFKVRVLERVREIVC